MDHVAPSLRHRNLVVVDIETSGANPFLHDALAVAFVPVEPCFSEFQIFIEHDEIQWNSFARKNFSRFENEWRAKAVHANKVSHLVGTYIRDTFGGNEVTLIGHNIGFDVAFLRKIATQGGEDQIAGISHRAVDTHTLLYVLALEGVIPMEARSSDGAFSHFGLQFRPDERHTALHDARATRELFIRLIQTFERHSQSLPRFVKIA